jgi:hypothetical protein
MDSQTPPLASSTPSKEDVGERQSPSLTGSLTPAADEDATPEESSRSVHGFRWVIVCCSLYLGALIYGLDTSIAADIQAAVIDQFGEVEKLTWIGTAFPLGSVCAILPT